MLSAEAAGLVIAITEGLIRLSGRLDLLLAEKEATTGPLVLPMRQIALPVVPRAQRIQRLKAYLAATEDAAPDPLGDGRTALAELVKPGGATDEVDAWFARIFPGEAGVSLIDPDAEFTKALRIHLPGVDVDRPETRLAAFYVTAGRDGRELNYAARTALLVADTIAEVGTQNAALVVHDPALRGVVTSIVGHLARPDLETFTEWSPLLRHALGAALDGLLANRGALEGAGPWVDAIFAALAMAREESASGEDFVTGLVRGRGYRTLLGKGLLVAGDRLAPDGADPYRRIAADILRAAAPLAAKGSASFQAFFNDNWGELLRAGLASIDRHGAVLLEGTKPLVREASIALIAELVRTPGATELSGETLFRVADAVIGTVARNPGLVTGEGRDAWFREVVSATTKAVSDQGVRKAFTRDGLKRVATQAIAVFVDHPDLLVEKPSKQLALVTAVVKAASAAGSADAATLATAAITAVLQRLGEEPALLDTRYAEILSALCGQLGKLVAAKTLNGIQAAELITAAADAVLRNPALFVRFEGNLATAVVTGVLKGAGSSELKLIGGQMLVELAGEVLRVVARRGRDMVEGATEKALADRIAATVEVGLDRAERELGYRVDRTRLPWVLAQLVAAVARGEVASIDPENPKFKEVFAQLAEAAA
jgi:hypothetical protein